MRGLVILSPPRTPTITHAKYVRVNLREVLGPEDEGNLIAFENQKENRVSVIMRTQSTKRARLLACNCLGRGIYDSERVLNSQEFPEGAQKFQATRRNRKLSNNERVWKGDYLMIAFEVLK